MHFYQRNLETAQVVNDVLGECKAMAALGRTYEAKNDISSALEWHERHLALAESHISAAKADNGAAPAGDAAASAAVPKARAGGVFGKEAAAAHVALVRCRTALAERLEREGQDTEAAESFQAALYAAEAAGDIVSQAVSHFKLGRLAAHQGDPAGAIPHLQKYLTLVSQAAYPKVPDTDRVIDDGVGVGVATAALAAAYQAAGESDRAAEVLQEFLHNTAAGGEALALAEAHNHLGVLYNKQARFDDAIEEFNQGFHLRTELAEVALETTHAHASNSGPSAPMAEPAEDDPLLLQRMLQRAISAPGAQTGTANTQDAAAVVPHLEAARLALGVARGNASFDNYVLMAVASPSQLLKWKAAREGLPQPEPEPGADTPHK